jgi:hypothetical protein
LEALRWSATDWLRTDLPDDPPMSWDRQCLHWPLAFPEVFLEDGRTGFDAIVANPPFLGGKRISGALGSAYREHLVAAIAAGATGNADLVAYFLLRMCSVAQSVGSLATNTVSQGDTRNVGLNRLTAAGWGWTIQRAVKSEPWPNEANLEIAKVWLAGRWDAAATSDGRSVVQITASLDAARRVTGPAMQLASNGGQLFYASLVNGIGFVLERREAEQLLTEDAKYAEVVFPYVGGEDLNSSPNHTGSRWIINFHDWTLELASNYPACLEIVRSRVKPARDRLPMSKRRVRDNWWRYEHEATNLYEAIATLDNVIAIASTSSLGLPARAPAKQVFAHSVYVFGYGDDVHFGLLTSAFHWLWSIMQASTMRTDLRYTPTSCFETLAFPIRGLNDVGVVGEMLDSHRSQLMMGTQLGLTKTYNRVHNPDEPDPGIVGLRELHVELDHAVRDAYGWSDLALDHHHWETPQGMRFTISPGAKDELLDRLLELNHERYAAEVAAGLHDKKSKKGVKPKANRAAKASQAQEKLL